MHNRKLDSNLSKRGRRFNAYLKRCVEDDLEDKRAASGAVLIKGPKSCGKTETATQYAKSILRMDLDPQVPLIMATNPQLLLRGETPRLLDEWQEQPELWNYVRHEVDSRKSKGEEKAQETVRKALAVGADRGIHVKAEGIVEPLAVIRMIRHMPYVWHI